MKSMYFFLLTFLFSLSSLAQATLDRQVIAAAGNSAEVPGLILDWTVGEPFVLTMIQGECVLTQGFHQPNDLLNSAAEADKVHLQYKIYPNPVASYLQVEMQSEKYADMGVILFSLDGKVLSGMKATFTGEHKLAIRVSDLPSATYVIAFLDKNSKQFMSHKVTVIH